MPTLSVVILTKNEASNLPDCLQALDWVDEVLVMDSGSEDATVTLARERGARVEVRTDWAGYGAQRQRAEALVTSDWVLMIDADERVTPELRASIEAVVQANVPVVGELPRLSWCFGRYIRHSGWYPDWVARLYPRGQAGYDEARVHESVQNPHALPIRKLQGDLLHFTYRNLRHYLEKSARYADDWSEARRQQGRSSTLRNALLHAFGCFVKMYLVKAGFLDGRQGFLLAALSSHSTFVKYADLWIKTRTVPSPVQRPEAS